MAAPSRFDIHRSFSRRYSGPKKNPTTTTKKIGRIFRRPVPSERTSVSLIGASRTPHGPHGARLLFRTISRVDYDSGRTSAPSPITVTSRHVREPFTQSASSPLAAPRPYYRRYFDFYLRYIIVFREK